MIIVRSDSAGTVYIVTIIEQKIVCTEKCLS